MQTVSRFLWIFYFALLFILVFPAADTLGARTKQPVPPARKNALELEVTAVSAGVSYARWTWGGWFLGVGIGLGPAVMLDNFDSIWGYEFGHVRGFISGRTFSWLTIDAGPYLGLNAETPSGDFGFTPMCGGEVTALAGWRRVKIGPSVQAGWLPEWDKSYFAVTPVTVRVTLDW